MKLTGKCREDFENWLAEIAFNEFIKSDEPEFNGEEVVELFWVSPDSMKWGVIQDFADSVGIDLKVIKLVSSNEFWTEFKNKLIVGFETRNEARIEAVIQFNIWYNE